ncbi:hypothetical protein WG66_008992, partial [Moniliophthora roreri]
MERRKRGCSFADPGSANGYCQKYIHKTRVGSYQHFVLEPIAPDAPHRLSYLSLDALLLLHRPSFTMVGVLTAFFV